MQHEHNKTTKKSLLLYDLALQHDSKNADLSRLLNVTVTSQLVSQKHWRSRFEPSRGNLWHVIYRPQKFPKPLFCFIHIQKYNTASYVLSPFQVLTSC